MARVTNVAAAARREAVGSWWVKGASVSRIAQEVRADRETVRRDLAVLGRRLVAETDVPAQLHRLLRACQEVEAAAWQGEQLGLVLASLKAQVTVLATLQGLDVAQRLEAVEATLATLTAHSDPLGGIVTANGRHAPV